MKKRDSSVFKTPFSASYWKLAASEFSHLQIIVTAALFIALRIAVKSLKIPVAANLTVSFDFLVNSVGSMIYGPLVGLVVGAVSDTLGFLLSPSGVYFFPFIFVEMSSSFLFGLFFYRAKLSQTRIILSRFTVTVFCNLILTPAILELQSHMLGDAYRFLSLPRVIKNICEFPFQSIILIFWLGSISLVTDKMHLTFSEHDKLKPTKNNIIFIACATAVAALAVVFYCLYKSNT